MSIISHRIFIGAAIAFAAIGTAFADDFPLSGNYTQNVACKEASVSSFYECTAHKNGEPGARAIIKIGDHEEVTVEKCTPVDPSAPNEPCTGIGVPGDEEVP